MNEEDGYNVRLRDLRSASENKEADAEQKSRCQSIYEKTCRWFGEDWVILLIAGLIFLVVQWFLFMAAYFLFGL
jgi:hypothetical protein